MAAYKFKLQKLLDFRTNMEEEKKNQLSLALKRLEQEKDRLSELKARQREMDKALKEKTSQGIAVN
ncbi:MAG TPA: hypothetical protein VN580_01865, partial [Clostridia bacterium]|nr:hypothetical protein [Clostridia bacterium]